MLGEGHGRDQPLDSGRCAPDARGPGYAPLGERIWALIKTQSVFIKAQILFKKTPRVPERSIVEPLGEAMRSRRVVPTVAPLFHHPSSIIHSEANPSAALRASAA